MKLVKRRRENQLQINMTPMIDVTFLLLIFFMTVTQVSAVNKEQLQLPQLKGTLDQSEASLTVNVDPEGAVIVSGNIVTLPELATMLSTELGKVDNDPSRLTVVLRADRRGTCRTVNEVVEVLTRLDISRVRMAVEATAS
jgi:biopolymer transport protein ExbD